MSSSATFAAFRAGLMAVSETSTIGRDGEPMRASYLRNVTARGRAARMLELAQAALDDLESDTPLDARRRTAVFIGLPDQADLSDVDASAFIKLFRAVLVPRIRDVDGAIHTFRHGRAAFFFALEAAFGALLRERYDAAIVGSADSLCSPDALSMLDSMRRISGPAIPQGLIPGEGAAFALLERSPPATVAQPGVPALLLSVASGHEARHFLQSLPCAGEAMTSVLRAVREHPVAGSRRADLLYTCETGERFWTEELSMAYLRNEALMPEPFVRTMAGEAFGDAGAAAGAVLFGMALSVLAGGRGRSLGEARAEHPAQRLLLCGSSDRGQVGACLLQGAGRAPHAVARDRVS